MNNWYKPEDCFVGPYKAIRNKVTKDEVIVGRYGQISAVAEKRYQVILLSHRLARQYLPEAKHPVRAGDEIVFTIGETDLAKWKKALKVYSNREPMIHLVEAQMKGEA